MLRSALPLKQNPALVSAKEDEIAANYAIDDAVGALLPQLSVQGGYSYSQQSYNSSLGAGSVVHGLGAIAQLNVPIYQGGAEESAIRQAKQLHAQAEMNVTVADRQVRDAVSGGLEPIPGRTGQHYLKSRDARGRCDRLQRRQQGAAGGRADYS